MSATVVAKHTARELEHLAAVARDLLDTPERMRGDWDRLCREVARTGQIEDLHAGRKEYLAVYENYLKILTDFADLMATVGSPLAGDFRRATDDLRRLRDEIFSRWVSQDDLEQILLDKLSLPNSVLIELAREHPPPQSWYDETGNPFVPE